MHSFETRPTSSKRAEGEGRGEEEERRRGEEGKGREGAGGGGMSGAGHDRAKSKMSGSETNSPNTTGSKIWISPQYAPVGESSVAELNAQHE